MKRFFHGREEQTAARRGRPRITIHSSRNHHKKPALFLNQFSAIPTNQSARRIVLSSNRLHFNPAQHQQKVIFQRTIQHSNFQKVVKNTKRGISPAWNALRIHIEQ
jgi:hypothetical protein